MGLHQQAFRAGEPAAAAKVPEVASPQAVVLKDMRALSGDPWVAPEEARVSNFVQIQEEAQPQQADAAPNHVVPKDDLPLGSWFELLVDGNWVRTQLTWASPHGTLYLFTSALGTSQSMTRRSRDKLVSTGSLRVISGAPVVDGALNAVAQIALRNSMDSQV